jgi:hypothetical protein
LVSRLLGKGISRTNALEALVLASFVRGLSVRDVEAALAEALGPRRHRHVRQESGSRSPPGWDSSQITATAPQGRLFDQRAPRAAVTCLRDVYE